MRRLSPLLAAAATGSDGESPRARFRRHLRAGGVDLTSLGDWLARAAPQIELDQEARLAAEEIANRLGEILGFDVARDDDAGAGIWTSPTGVTIVVRIVSTAGVPAQLQSLSQLRDRRLAGSGDPANKLSALAIVCGSQVDWRRIEDAVRLRRALESGRLASADAVLALAGLRERRVLAHVDAVTLLRPQPARADAMIELVTRYAALGSERGDASTGVESVPPVSPPARTTRRGLPRRPPDGP
jgi:hypothetical protein